MGDKIVNNLVAVPSTQLKPNTTGTRDNRKKFHQIYAGTNYYKFSFFSDVSAPLERSTIKSCLGSWPRGIQRFSL